MTATHYSTLHRMDSDLAGIRADIGTLRSHVAEMKPRLRRVETDVAELKWMLATNLAGTRGVLWKLLQTIVKECNIDAGRVVEGTASGRFKPQFLLQGSVHDVRVGHLRLGVKPCARAHASSCRTKA